MSYVLTFLGGVVFAFVVSGCVIYWLAKPGVLAEECPHCDGTGVRVDTPEPMEQCP